MTVSMSQPNWRTVGDGARGRSSEHSPNVRLSEKRFQGDPDSKKRSLATSIEDILLGRGSSPKLHAKVGATTKQRSKGARDAYMEGVLFRNEKVYAVPSSLRQQLLQHFRPTQSDLIFEKSLRQRLEVLSTKYNEEEPQAQFNKKGRVVRLKRSSM